jgi:excisionase family DNA binding protein
MTDVLLPLAEAQRRLAVSRATLYELMRSGALRSVRFGRNRRVAASELDRFITEHTQPGVSGERGTQNE